MTASTEPSRIYVAGTRTFSAEVAGFAQDAGFQVVGLLEPYDRLRVGTRIHGFPVSWLEETAPPEGAAAVVGTGEPARREIVARLQGAGWKLLTLVHPRAHVARSSFVGEGTIVAPGVIVGACGKIAEHVILGRGVLVGHHTEIGPFATLGPAANIAGNVKIGADAFIGMGAVVRDHVAIGALAAVGMGAVVVSDVAESAEVWGLPATERGSLASPRGGSCEDSGGIAR
jgi:UDP-N-acetylbacillosamine N-acetyltransferase